MKVKIRKNFESDYSKFPRPKHRLAYWFKVLSAKLLDYIHKSPLSPLSFFSEESYTVNNWRPIRPK